MVPFGVVFRRGGENLMRHVKDIPIEELVAGDTFRNTMLSRADGMDMILNAPVWHGWVIMDAFLAGIEWQKQQTIQKPLQRPSEDAGAG